MTKEEKSKVKYRMKRLARKFCRRNSVYNYFDSCVWELIEKAYLTSYLQCLHENKHTIVKLERKLEQAEKDLSDYQFNYPTIKELQKENAELKTDNAFYEKACEGATMMYEHLTKAKELIKKFLDANSNLDMINAQRKAEQFLKEIDK